MMKDERKEKIKEIKELIKFHFILFCKNTWLFIKKIALPIFITLLFAIALTVILMHMQADTVPYKILYELDKAIVVTGVVGGFAKAITENVFSIMKRESLLKDVGIVEVTAGRSTNKQINKTFGLCGEDRPECLKYFFVTGENYFRKNHKRIVRMVKKNEGKVHIQILLAKKEINGERNPFLTNMDKFKNEEKTKEELEALEKNKVNYIEKIFVDLRAAGIVPEDYIEIRGYVNEYRLSLHIATYENQRITCWSDMIPPNLTSFVFSGSSMFVSEYNPQKDNAEISYAYKFNEYFNAVWEMYDKEEDKIIFSGK